MVLNVIRVLGLFFVFHGGTFSSAHMFKLALGNSVFQAEIIAIFYAVQWAVTNDNFITIYSDSYSSILFLQNPEAKSEFLINIKSFLANNNNAFNLHWIKAHVGHHGNEVADSYAKRACLEGVPITVPLPWSLLKKNIGEEIKLQWQSLYYDTLKEEKIYQFLPCVSDEFFLDNRHLVLMILEHGPFPHYLHRLNLRPLPD